MPALAWLSRPAVDGDLKERVIEPIGRVVVVVRLVGAGGVV